MENPYVIGIISWFLPGVGHLLQGKVRRGLIIGIAIWTMFVIALISGGAYSPAFEFKDGWLLYILNFFARLGNGLGAFISFILMASPPPNVASWATFEYGSKFLEVAGLLNYLAAIDTFDLSIGRKK